jgi:hypothetical protein
MPPVFSKFVAIVCLLGTYSAIAWGDEAEKLQKWKGAFNEKILPILQSRCLECHRGDKAEGELNLEKFSSGEEAAANLDLWERVGKRIRLKEMPPEGSPQLDDPQKSTFHQWLDAHPKPDLCSKLATDETQAWYRGFVMSRRLTRTEYLNAVRDVTGIAVDSQFEIPSDGSGGEGFDTNGDSLFTSPIHIEQYLAVATDVIDRAVTAPKQSNDSRLSDASLTGFSVVAPGKQPGGNELTDIQAAELTLRIFARRAWRRPIDDEETGRLLQLFDAGLQQSSDYSLAIREPLKAILVSPNFLFVVETEAAEGGVQRLTPHQLATRLALFLWSSIPDAELLARADAGELDTPEQVIAETRRMLKDPKARYLGENFGLQWLGLANLLTSVRPDAEIYPQYNAELAADLREEAIQTIANVFREDRSLRNLIDAPYIYANGKLAQHYGLQLPTDSGWQKIDVSDQRRGGVLTLGATLMNTSYPRRTSPVLRGRWLLEDVLGSQVPPPPPNVPALEDSVADQTASLRDRLELHRKNPECASCHNRMDPLGFGLENFDALGRWRDADRDHPIDASGTLPSGEKFNGPGELKQLVLRRAQEFEKHFVKKLLGFALGRELNKFDHCVIDDSLKALQEQEHRAGSVIETIVVSYPFQHRYFKAAK